MSKSCFFKHIFLVCRVCSVGEDSLIIQHFSCTIAFALMS